MPDVDIQLNVRDVNGDLILALEDETNGYWVYSEGMPKGGRAWKGPEIASPWADGAADGLMTLARNEESVIVEVTGSPWAQVVGRYQALLAATSSIEWLLEEVIEGVSTTWRCGPVEAIPAPVSSDDVINGRRYVVLAFRTQPTPTVTGI